MRKLPLIANTCNYFHFVLFLFRPFLELGHTYLSLTSGSLGKSLILTPNCLDEWLWLLKKFAKDALLLFEVHIFIYVAYFTQLPVMDMLFMLLSFRAGICCLLYSASRRGYVGYFTQLPGRDTLFTLLSFQERICCLLYSASRRGYVVYFTQLPGEDMLFTLLSFHAGICRLLYSASGQGYVFYFTQLLGQDMLFTLFSFRAGISCLRYFASGRGYVVYFTQLPGRDIVFTLQISEGFFNRNCSLFSLHPTTRSVQCSSHRTCLHVITKRNYHPLHNRHTHAYIYIGVCWYVYGCMIVFKIRFFAVLFLHW